MTEQRIHRQVTETDPRSGTPLVKSTVRTVAVLEFLASRGTEPTRLRDVSEAIDAPKSSTYAVLQTLTHEGWVQVDQTGNLYSLGIRALLTGTSYLDVDPVVQTVRPVLVEVADHLDETVHLGRLDGEQVVYLATIESRQYLRPFSRVGRRLPATATALGKVLLAGHVDDPDFHLPDTLTAVTSKTVTDPALILSELREAQKRGYAIDREEAIIGVTCFAFPLRTENPSRDAISCSVPNARLTPNREHEIIEAMSQAQTQIEQSTRLVSRSF